jgi:peptidoglycan hydrolase-like protein with peptidoglycan-binding domain
MTPVQTASSSSRYRGIASVLLGSCFRYKSSVWIATLALLVIPIPHAFAQSVLRLGSTGFEVEALQRQLQDLNFFGGQANGIYGEDTVAAVREFQRFSRLTDDGVAGPDTFQELNRYSYGGTGNNPPAATFYDSSFSSAAAPASQGTDLVVQVQRSLRDRGYYRGSIDGLDGPETQRAVERFQRDRGLRVDGVIGQETLSALGLQGDRDPAYVVVVPDTNTTTLSRVRSSLRDLRGNSATRVFSEPSRKGRFVNAGAFANREEAESISQWLRSRGLDARVVYR